MDPQDFNQDGVEKLLESRGESFDRLRRAYFSKQFNALEDRFNDPDKVTSFVARQLVKWKNGPSPMISETTDFLETGMYQSSASLRRNAANWGPTQALTTFVAKSQHKNEVIDQLMLIGLMRQPESPYILAALINIFTAPSPLLPKDEQPSTQLLEPEVLIRMALEYPLDNTWAIDALVERVLPGLSAQRAAAAIDHELSRSKKSGVEFPSKLLEYRRLIR